MLLPWGRIGSRNCEAELLFIVNLFVPVEYFFYRVHALFFRYIKKICIKNFILPEMWVMDWREETLHTASPPPPPFSWLMASPSIQLFRLKPWSHLQLPLRLISYQVLPVLPQKSLSPQPQNRQRDRWDRTINPGTDWSTYKYLVCDNGDISNPCGKEGLFNKWCWKKINPNP